MAYVPGPGSIEKVMRNGLDSDALLNQIAFHTNRGTLLFAAFGSLLQPSEVCGEMPTFHTAKTWPGTQRSLTTVPLHEELEIIFKDGLSLLTEELRLTMVKSKQDGARLPVEPWVCATSCLVLSLPIGCTLPMQGQVRTPTTLLNCLALLRPGGPVAPCVRGGFFYDSKHAANVSMGQFILVRSFT